MDSNNKARVLVVDDDPALQKLVRTLLLRGNMETIAALDAASAAQELRKRPLPDIVVLDMMLPDVNGLEFLRQMRAKPAYDDLPVVILSALADPEQIRAGLNAGADRYLTKPYLANNLITTLQDLIRVGRRQS